MVRQLLELPPELLVQTLALLSLHDLLKFSQTSRYSRLLANSNLHTLSLGVHLTRTSYLSRRLDSRRYTQLDYWPLALEEDGTAPSSSVQTDEESRRVSSAEDPETADDDDDDDHNMKWVRLPHAELYDYATLYNFHDALFESVLLRHGTMLQTLTLSLWTLTTKVARSVAQLSALRSLTIKIEEDQCTRAVSRPCIAQERVEQDRAWSLLAKTAVWALALRVLRIQNAGINHSQLATLLHSTRLCQELSLTKCNYLGKRLWVILAGSWPGRATLQRLVVAGCASFLDDAALEAIGKLNALQVSNV